MVATRFTHRCAECGKPVKEFCNRHPKAQVLTIARSSRLELRVADTEKLAWERAARKSGLQLSQWIRVQLNAAERGTG